LEKVFTLILRKILLYDYIYYTIFILSIIFVVFRINFFRFDYSYLNNDYFVGVIEDLYFDNDKLVIDLDIGIRCNYYVDNNEEFDFSLGDTLKVYGEIYIPSSNTNSNLFNYNNFLKSKNIYYLVNVTEYEKIIENKNIFYKFKNFIISIINDNLCYKYLYAFILGDTRYIDSEVKSSYQSLGISHLFSISGMHISIISGILLFIFKKIKFSEEKRYFLVSIFIVIFMFLVNLCPSVLRSGIFFILLSINNIFYFHIKPINLLLLTVSIIVFFNPFIIYNNGFLYSSIITGSLILFGNLINNYKNYFSKLFMTSFISFMFSFPLSIYSYFQINILSILYNLIFVPLVSIIIFPLSLICLFLPFFSFILEFSIYIMEFLAVKLSMIESNIIFMKPSLFVLILYYLFICFLFYYRKKSLYLLFLIALFIHYNYNVLFSKKYVLMLDVGQGDSILIHTGDNNILIDTGGKKFSNDNLSDNTLIPLFKSFGIRKLDHLVLSHGDYDHMGEAINLVENFKVKKVIFNCGEFNELEQDLIKVLDRKKIPYYSCIKQLNLDDNKLYFLNNKDYGNENDNSNVIYTELNNHKFLFMGDAGVEVEEDIIEKYNLKDIDVLKVGHHGSKTSSGKKFIDEINPQNSIISVGKNNRYGHPNKEVLESLKDSKVYRTDEDGSIMFKIKNNKLEIETCAP